MAKCAVCSNEYTKSKPLQTVCGVPCALLAVEARRVAKLAKSRQKPSMGPSRRQRPVTMNELRGRAQTAVNKYIRKRDEHLSCVSCGQSPYQGQRHASHYRSRGAASQLAYNTFNNNASCAQCNSMKSGNLIEYRKELVRRIGEDRVERLEYNNELANYTEEYLKRLAKIFNKRVRHLEKIKRHHKYASST